MAATDETMRLLHGMKLHIGGSVDDTTDALAHMWGVAWNEIAGQLDNAIRDLIVQGADGRWPARSLIYRSERAQRALAAVKASLDALSARADVQITGAAWKIPADAAKWESQIIASQMPEQAGTLAVLSSTFHRVDQEALEAIVKRATGQITALHKPLSIEATKVMKATLIRGVALGDNPNTAARVMLSRMQGGFDGGLTRATVIARTEMLDASRAGSMAQDLANPDVVTGWAWSAEQDERTCISCIEMDGTEFPADEPGPDDHQQGRCARLPITATWADLGFDIPEPPSVAGDARDWFDAQPQDTQLAIMGPARYDLYQSGQASWGDFSTARQTDGWRDSRVPTSVADLAA